VLDSSESTGEVPVIETTRIQPAPDLSSIDFSLGEEAATMSEVGTKLDLARAYIDMGDPKVRAASSKKSCRKATRRRSRRPNGSCRACPEGGPGTEMSRVAVGLEYDGTAFSGWQYQPHARTVQGELQSALARIAAHPVLLTAAGRTDAGVHAFAQVAHFETERRANRTRVGVWRQQRGCGRRTGAVGTAGRRRLSMRATARSRARIAT
jgi:hypothetical protein